MNKKILIHSIVFSPDGVSTAYLYNDLAIRFKNEGFDVSVLTTTPHYNLVESESVKQPLKRRALGLYYQSSLNGIKVKHVYQNKFKNTLLRLLGFIYWHIVSFTLGLFEKNVNYILSPSPPLTIGFINILLGKIKKAKVIYNVQEIYPDLLIEQGGLKFKPAIKLLKWLERFVYNNSNAITTIDQIFYNTISPRIKDKSKLHIIPNFVDTEIYKPILNIAEQLDKNIFPKNNSIKLMYAGNIGHAQDWIPLIKVASELKDESFEFFIIGEGAMKDYLKKEKASKNLKNLHLLPYQPRELIPSILAYSDIQFIFMSPNTEGHGFPSKVYTIMASAKPLLVCSGENTPIVNFLSGKDCAFIETERDLDKKVINLVKTLRVLRKNDLVAKGVNGLKYIKSSYSKEIVTKQYIDLISSL